MTINLNGVEFYTAQEVDARIREAIAEKDRKVDMENLPIGTLVKVVGNRAGHEHEIGEILPITEVDEGILGELYRLDGRSVGWASVKDIEFISFPEEEESTTGDEGFEADEEDADKPEPKFEVGDTVKVLRNITEGYDEGTIGKVVEILPWGSLMIESDCGGPYIHPGSTLELVEESELEFKVGDKVRVKGADYHCLIDGDIGTIREIAESIKHTHNGRLIPTPYEVSNSTDIGQWVAPEHLELIDGESEEDSEKYPAVGTKVKAKRETPWTTVGKVYEVLGITEPRPYPIRVSDDEDDDIYTLKMFEEFFEILKPSEEDDSGIKAGDIVIATEDELDITAGTEYEIKARETGTLYFFDDDGDIRHVNVHEEILRKKTAKRGFKKGDVVYVNEEITDYSGDTICPGVLAEFIVDKGVLTPDESLVVVEDGDIGKLTLVCRAEDRLDIYNILEEVE